MKQWAAWINRRLQKSTQRTAGRSCCSVQLITQRPRKPQLWRRKQRLNLVQHCKNGVRMKFHFIPSALYYSVMSVLGNSCLLSCFRDALLYTNALAGWGARYLLFSSQLGLLLFKEVSSVQESLLSKCAWSLALHQSCQWELSQLRVLQILRGRAIIKLLHCEQEPFTTSIHKPGQAAFIDCVSSLLCTSNYLHMPDLPSRGAHLSPLNTEEFGKTSLDLTFR